jgi:hypothetical protein
MRKDPVYPPHIFNKVCGINTPSKQKKKSLQVKLLHNSKPSASLEFPSQYFVLNDITRKFNGLTQFCVYIVPIDLWMEKFCGEVSQPWYSLGFLLHRYYLT